MSLPGCRPARRGFWLSWEVPPLQNLSPGPGGFSSRVGCGGDPRARTSWGSASPDAVSLPSLWHQNGSRWERRELLSQPSCFPGLGSPPLPRVCIKGQRWASQGESKVGGGLVPQKASERAALPKAGGGSQEAVPQRALLAFAPIRTLKGPAIRPLTP